MVSIKKEGVVFNKTALGFENEGVMNPAAIYENGFTHIFYRAVSKGNYSSVGYCKLNAPMEVIERHDYPLIFPQLEIEQHGVEDPRIVKIDDLYYLSYCAYDGVNALGALATSSDMHTWVKKGIIVPQFTYLEFIHLAESKEKVNEKYIRFNTQPGLAKSDGKPVFVWDKNVIFFPRRINGKLHFFHRIKPDIQLVVVNEIEELTVEFWQNYILRIHSHIVMAPQHKHEVSYIGGGCPPIETKEGWLVIYHGVHDTVNGYVYVACAALLNLENPLIEIARLPYPLFKPELDWELKGEVNNVCFPTGAIEDGDKLYIYYGAADEHVACASLSMSELISELLNHVKH